MTSRSTLDQVAATVWLAVVAGFVELAVLGWRKYIGHSFLGESRDIVWLTPLAYVLLALIGLSAASMAGRLWPRLGTARVRLGVVVMLMAGSLLSLAGGLSKWAILMLALGICVQGSRWLARSAGFHRVVRATWLPLMAVPVLVGGGGAAIRYLDRHRAIAALPSPPANAPNVLIIVWDVVRAGSVSAMGYERRTTPYLEAFAKGGVKFTHAQAPSSWTLPSHASMFTGHEAFELSSDWAIRLDATYPTLAEQFGRQGYLTGGFVGNLFNCGYEGGLQRGFQTYEDYRLSPGELLRSFGPARAVVNWERFRRLTGYWDSPGRKSATQVNDRFLHWLDRRGSRPFFAFLNYFDAHDPFLPRAPFDTLYGPVLPRLDPGFKSSTAWTPDGIRAERDSYERAIAGLDADFGRLVAQLESRGLLRNTLVIVVGDHGEEFGEHGQMSHGRTLYLTAAEVPLVLRFPGRVPAGRTIDRVISTRDLAASIQSLASLNGPAFPGRSLERTWGSSADSPGAGDAVFGWLSRNATFPAAWQNSGADVWAVTWQGWRYIRYGSREELYFLPDDPHESSNVLQRTPAPDILPRLRGAIDSIEAIRESFRRSIRP